ncbi:hypothetical protein [Kordia jejudonensis]|uniref:hypothetical protein n=1 Tax=Kordia jejudonensis TaxID=1348245 RepID=UPI00062977A6|nr:hypothetical protein [Kordia jejudonensis]
MNKKVKTYILLTVVLGIWGTIGYQLYAKLNPTEEPIVTSNDTVSFAPKEDITKDTFAIQSDHYDPFLNTPYQKNRASSQRKRNTHTKATITFPNILYRGTISKQNSADNIYILEINGTQQLFKVRKQIDGVTLMKGTKKSVVVSYKGQRKEITIQ